MPFLDTKVLYVDTLEQRGVSAITEETERDGWPVTVY